MRRSSAVVFPVPGPASARSRAASLPQSREQGLQGHRSKPQVVGRMSRSGEFSKTILRSDAPSARTRERGAEAPCEVLPIVSRLSADT